MIEPNWDYFIHAPLDEGVIRFKTKTERALHAKVVATEANWVEYQTSECLEKWWRAKKDLEAFQQGQAIRRKRENPWNKLQINIWINKHRCDGTYHDAWIDYKAPKV